MSIPEIVEGRSLLLRRWIAAWFDFIACFGILVVGDYLLGTALYQRTMAFWLVLALSYFPVLEGLTGKTLGRLVTGTIVVDVDGNPPGIRRAIQRTILRLVEVNPILLGGLPAGIAVLASQHHQRLGDMWARTYVLRETELATVRSSSAFGQAPPVAGALDT
jgi:uncharacterized RDD family membrane protein YckC